MKKNKLFKIIKGKEKDKNALISVDFCVSYGELKESVKNIERQLDRFGVKKGDLIALSLPIGLDYYLLLLAITNNHICLPINSDLGKEELEGLLKRSGARAIIYPDSCEEKYSGLDIVQLVFYRQESNVFIGPIKRRSKERKHLSRKKTDNSTMIILTTSGTTSVPKFVPLTEGNIKAGAANLIKTLKLTKKDACLSVMAPFHVHGLMVALSTLISGGSLLCLAGFNGKTFFELFDKYQPTWFTGSPVVHSAILKYLEVNKLEIKNRELRFIRSSSAPLPINTLEELEKTFQVPVSESYGMTEAALQITANPLPPRERKPGSVGISAGPQVKAVDKNGEKVKKGQVGEIIIKGKNLIGGYWNSASENKRSFIKGWFRTGDLGYFDGDNYLYIVGRKKEMINKGGENISPKEIDEFLMKHPSVESAAAFAVPHPTLGEDINAAIVLRDSNNKARAEEIRRYLLDKISRFKVPTKIYVIKEMPRTSAGKIIRGKIPQLIAGKETER